MFHLGKWHVREAMHSALLCIPCDSKWNDDGNRKSGNVVYLRRDSKDLLNALKMWFWIDAMMPQNVYWILLKNARRGEVLKKRFKNVCSNSRKTSVFFGKRVGWIYTLEHWRRRLAASKPIEVIEINLMTGMKCRWDLSGRENVSASSSKSARVMEKQ
jgi:hypothetical protein